ncbi:hypothetical protein B4135_4164 [Caldibacillus debilis]|uniref:Uncharacterized protein n=1 Tax=Caldibacillus debilis TaxID=301148 RepID=A0A150L6S4_9BACI|nr:hypothetical protein B4135_4164 [Caldibacillus debilis]
MRRRGGMFSHEWPPQGHPSDLPLILMDFPLILRNSFANLYEDGS